MNSALDQLKKQFEVLAEIDLSSWVADDYETSNSWLAQQCQQAYRSEFRPQQRVVFLHSQDYYVQNDTVGLLLKNLQLALNEQDISSCFVTVVSTNPNIANEIDELQNINSDSANQLNYCYVSGAWQPTQLTQYPYSRQEEYQYGSANPIKIRLDQVSQREKFLLSESKVFCMYPWIHLHAFPNGDAHPCCYSEMAHQIGTTKTHTLEEIWNDQPMRDLRTRMLSEQPSNACKKCYEQESMGFFSGRQSANKHHGHHIARVSETSDSGQLQRFEMTYWDIRFSNLCNLKCRSCGHIFSSQWYQDQARLAGGDWRERNTVLNYAGRTETDMWQQLIPHLDYVEQIYFAGGEPLLMEEHYNILEELVKRGRFDVRLIYNTNFTHTDLKGRSVFEYWNKFKSVAVGASLDDMGARGEYIRKGTKWAVIEQNRRDMMRICPQVDFYISPTLSIMNALSLPDFHRNWVEQGLIRAQDLNVNILQDPQHYRIDIAPAEYKARIKSKYQDHLNWLRPQDHLNRATVGFESAVTLMNSADNTHLIDTFWRKTHELDSIRNERCLTVIPELKALL